MSRCMPPGVEHELIKTWMESGIEEMVSSDTCSYNSGKRFKEHTCKRHGCEHPPLKRYGGGQCPVRVEFLTPAGTTGGDTVRVIIVLRGTHSHVFPVCKPSGRLVQSVVLENPSASIRNLQVCSVFFLLFSCFRMAVGSLWLHWNSSDTDATNLLTVFLLLFSTGGDQRRQRRGTGQQFIRSKVAALGARNGPSLRTGPTWGHGPLPPLGLPPRVRQGDHPKA